MWWRAVVRDGQIDGRFHAALRRSALLGSARASQDQYQ